MCLVVITALTMLGGSASALLFGDGGVGLQAAFDNITIGPNPGVSSTNVLTDFFDDTSESYWSIDASGGSVNTLVIEVAQWARSYGRWDIMMKVG